MSLQVAHLSSELSGGAGIAAERLHEGLRREGISSRLYYAKGEPRTADCVALYPASRFGFDALAEWVSELQAPRHVPGVYFTRPTWYRGPRWERFSPAPQVLHLHWISRWLDQPRLFMSLPRELPVIWSLHDLNPLTGGCHLPGACERFTRECGECPQLRRPGMHDRAQRIFALKDDCYAGLNLHVVGNSEWTTAQARRSPLLRHARSFQTIHLGLDPDAYHPVDRTAARLALGLAPEAFVAGMGCANLATANKGALHLVQALHGLGGESAVTLIAFGDGHLPLAGPGVQTREFGYLASPDRQSAFYSACDVFVVPSLVESFGLTALEAAACGTPVLAYRTGGLPEVVVDGTTGLLVSAVGSVDALREGLRWLKDRPERRREMGRAGRARVEQHFTLEGMARAYTALYRAAT